MTDHFQRKEFACKCGCGFDCFDYELLTVLSDVREHFDAPVVITSGNRCDTHNKAISGHVNSYHKRGMAADIIVKGVDPIDVFSYLDQKYFSSLGVGGGKGFTHIDVRAIPNRWQY